MARHNPAAELELSERTVLALLREAEHPGIELHRRAIAARNQAGHVACDRLLDRIASTLAGATAEAAAD